MRPFRIVRPGCLVLILSLVFGSSSALTGCGSGSVSSPVEQAKAGQEGAKSSMDYMRKHINDSKGTIKSKHNIATH